MKIALLFSKLVLLGLLSLSSNALLAEENKKITHVVMVWLNEPSNEQHRNEFIKASEQLNDLPGIVSRHVGVVSKSKRSIVDDTFDVAVSVTLESKAALKAYLKNPRHKKILKEKLKPLINRAVAYDFVSQ